MRRSEAAARDPAVARRLAPAERDRDPRRRMAGSLLAVLFLGAIVAPAAVPLFAAHAQIWDGYYLLGGERGGGLGGASLERVFAGSVTPAAPVRFTTFGGFAEVPVDRLAQRLDRVDPRFDPFLRGVTGLFAAGDPSGREWSLGYLRTDLPPAGLLLRLAFRAPAAARAVLDFDVRGRLLAAGLVAAVAVAAIGVRSVAGRLASGLGMAGIVAPWTVAALNAGGVAVIAAAAVVPALWRLPGPVPARAAGGAAAAVAVVVTASFLIAGALAGFAVSAASLGSIAATASSSVRRTALPVGPRRRSADLVASGSLVALATVVATAGASLPAVWVPAPEAGSAARVPDGLTWEGLRGLGVSDGDRGALPNAADYVAHVAFQEGLPYGRTYRLPTEGERLTVSSFRFDARERRLLRRESVVAIYDRSWLQRTISEAGGAGRLLLDAGAVPVRRQRLADAARTGRETGAAVALGLAAAGISMGAALWARPARKRRP